MGKKELIKPKKECDWEKGIQCENQNIKTRTGVCRNCGGQAVQ